jgi:hypothetical protein
MPRPRLDGRTLAISISHLHCIQHRRARWRCGKMHDVTSNSFAATDPNKVEYGSDARRLERRAVGAELPRSSPMAAAPAATPAPTGWSA